MLLRVLDPGGLEKEGISSQGPVCAGAHCDLVNVFHDRKRLNIGENFMEKFIDAVCVSLVIAPVVSRHVLDRMNEHGDEGHLKEKE
jgi:hypothetical protein